MREQIWVETRTGIGRRMRHRRWMLGMTRERLADRIGVDLEHVKSIEAGETAFRMAELSTIAIALEVPISYFFDGTTGTDPDPCAAVMPIVVGPRAARRANRLFPIQSGAIEGYPA